MFIPRNCGIGAMAVSFAHDVKPKRSNNGWTMGSRPERAVLHRQIGGIMTRLMIATLTLTTAMSSLAHAQGPAPQPPAAVQQLQQQMQLSPQQLQQLQQLS